MARNSAGDGHLVNIIAGAAYDSGDPVQHGSQMFGVAIADIANGAVGTIQIDGGWTLASDAPGATTAFAAGDPVYWDDGNSECVTEVNSTGHLYIGTARDISLAAATTVNVILAGAGAGPNLNQDAAFGGIGIDPGATTIAGPWIAPYDCEITSIGLACTVQPATATGTYTMAGADVTLGGAVNILGAATIDLDATITAGTELAVALSAVAGVLELTAGDHIAFTFVSNTMDLVGEGLMLLMRYRATA